MSQVLITNGTLITMNASKEIVEAEIWIENDHIQKIGKKLSPKGQYKTISAKGCWIIPGLIQTHVHLCQTLFRNQAEDLTLLDWLRKRIWPFEGNHTQKTLRLSAELGIAELLKGGTTTILDMGTVHHTDEIFKAIESSGIRAFSGKAIMVEGEDIPKSLVQTSEVALEETQKLIERWHGKADGRIRYALAPRFVLSCNESVLTQIGDLSRKKKLLIHTHAAENREESQWVMRLKGKSNIRYINELGLCGPNLCLAHCVWVDKAEIEILAQTKTHVLHCPSSNLKLGSGIAPIPELLQQKVNVSIGADGAPCNNNLDCFQEMRLAGLIQRPKYGVQALSAKTIFEMATLNGAKTLGMENDIGSLEVGKKADMVIIDRTQLHSSPNGDPYTTLVYAAHASDVRTVFVNGRRVVADGKLLTVNEDEVRKQAKKH